MPSQCIARLWPGSPIPDFAYLGFPEQPAVLSAEL